MNTNTSAVESNFSRFVSFTLGMMLIVAATLTRILSVAWFMQLVEVGSYLVIALEVLFLVLFLALEYRGHQLHRMLGMDVDAAQPPLISGLAFFLLGVFWYFIANHRSPRQRQPGDPTAKPRNTTKHDTPRELAETMVFVVVLVMMLKLFVVEAFVIPTGSMAETQLGYHKNAICDKCGYHFPVNASSEAEGEDGSFYPIVAYRCPNCLYCGTFSGKDPGITSGDRVLVHKAMATDERGHVVVFKYPKEPQKQQVALNYIKRLMGFGGETLALYRGDFYTTRKLQYPSPVAQGVSALDVWKDNYMHTNDPRAGAQFLDDRKAGFNNQDGFVLFRKPDDIVLEMRRIVYDNDHQASDLAHFKVSRWNTDKTGWQNNTPGDSKIFSHTGDQLGWLRYQHLLPMESNAFEEDKATVFEPQRLHMYQANRTNVVFRPSVVTNFLGYNYNYRATGRIGPPLLLSLRKVDPVFWVGDLLLECRAKIDDPAAEVVMELSKGANRYQAVFAGGQVTLVITGPGGKQLAVRETPIRRAGTYDLRFANVDSRLRVWVDGKSIEFGTEADYTPAGPPSSYDPDDHRQEGWTRENDLLAPASLGAKGAVAFSKLKLWRDTYHTPMNENSLSVAEQLETYYVQPGHYFCMGDNSTQSSDSRAWGVVPERLMLGRAVFVFAPLSRIGFIR